LKEQGTRSENRKIRTDFVWKKNRRIPQKIHGIQNGKKTKKSCRTQKVQKLL